MCLTERGGGGAGVGLRGNRQVDRREDMREKSKHTLTTNNA